MAFCNRCGYDFDTVAPKFCSECGASQPSPRPNSTLPPRAPSAPLLIDDRGYPTETFLNLADTIFDAMDALPPASPGALSFSKIKHLFNLIGQRCESDETWYRMWQLYDCETRLVPIFGTTGRPKHLGILCDECEKYEFEGDRWKCQSCPDFDLCERCAGFMGPVPAPSKHKLGHRIALNSIPPPTQPALTRSGWFTLAHYSVLADPDNEFTWYVSVLDALRINFPLERSMFPAQADPQVSRKWEAFVSEERRRIQSQIEGQKAKIEQQQRAEAEKRQKEIKEQIEHIQAATAAMSLFRSTGTRKQW